MVLRNLTPLLLVFLALMAPVRELRAQDDGTNPAAFITNFSQKGISDILAAQIPENEKESRFRTMFKAYFDIPYIGRFVLGRYWRLTSDDQRRKFASLFEDVIVQTWTRRFSEYDGQTLKVSGTVDDGRTGAIVKSEIVDKDGSTIDVDWRVRKRENGFQVVDIVVAGVSMAITYRQEYSTVITRGGGFDALLSEMQKQVDNPKQESTAG